MFVLRFTFAILFNLCQLLVRNNLSDLGQLEGLTIIL